MTKAILTTILFLTISQLGFSQTNFDKEKLDSYFQALEDNEKFMGSVAVSKDGELLYTNSIGFADVENNVEATEETKYRIGSITKTFTTVLAMKAVENKMLDLDQTIDKWFPSIENASEITVEHLLGHRSGIHNFTNDEEYLTYNTQSKTEQELVDIIANGGSDFEPDSQAEYSNSNFVLLTYILEKTFEKPYSELVKEHIVEPIGLTDTYVFGNLDTANNEAKSYKFLNTWNVEPETDASIPLGAGAITSTPVDLTKFADALFAGKLVTPESLEIMKTIKDGYGKGLFQFPFYENIGYGHTGGIDGFSSVYTYFPESKVSYALTSNGTNINNNDISIAVLNAVYNKPYEIPSFTSYSLTTEELDPYLGVYASSQIPMKITITKEGATLIAQGTGQPAFPLEATEKDTFKFDQAGAKFQFNPSENSMILFQGGGQILFSKEQN
ncbi:CubicO group peptidase, beta-lactamase class C family [Nonlabens sp. Hel1_33_55]|uniref:serine hydrolase domain-containing protein n=1 Tax=Nonlabens sp. Hel1_33_55 TaxID=1336802 RepID=UPI000875ED93|nr:serine hydrolase domain-containing protein [Nonlabens sp. Hel1_33_55]SCY18055.1 CubicO group peptidase, beta-lactamase class C family [Nonlabens sp. Hel1_33_55]